MHHFLSGFTLSNADLCIHNMINYNHFLIFEKGVKSKKLKNFYILLKKSPENML